MKIIAFGDLHLDSAFSSCSVRSRITRRDIQKQIFSKIISQTKEKQADLLLISGDLFDIPAPSKEICDLVYNEIASLDCPVVISPGNHDYYVSGGVYDAMPDNVYVFKSEKMSRIYIESLDVCIDGYAFLSESYSKDPFDGYAPEHTDSMLIFNGHTDLGGPSSQYAPFNVAQLNNIGYQLASLGHIHTTSDPKYDGDCLVAFSGVIQGRSIDEPVNGHVNVFEASNGKVILKEKIDLSLWNNLLYCVSADDVTSDHELLRRIASEIYPERISKNDTLRVELVGEYDYSYTPNENYILTKIKELVQSEDVSLKNSATARINEELLLNDPSIVGVLYKTLFKNDEFISKYSEDARKRAFALAVKALKNDDIDPENI